MFQRKKLISIIIPLCNEAVNLPLIYAAITSVIDPLPYEFELIFVDDGSRDESQNILKSLSKADKRIQVIELVRNFGKEVATTAGLNHCHGEAAIMIDADLQHPADRIPDFLHKWEEGAEVVVGVRKTSLLYGTLLRRIASRIFYRTMHYISDTAIVPNSTDFRLVDRIVIEEFNRFTERNRLTRGLIDWLGFRHEYVYFDVAKRQHGKAAYGNLKLIQLAVRSFVSMSLLPLKLTGYLGAIITILAAPLGLFIFIEKYILGDPWHMAITGSAILAVILVFLVGIILMALGMIALYIATIHGEVVNRPLYVVRRPRTDSSKLSSYHVLKSGDGKK